MVADAIADAEEPWWVIGSAAVALHGAKVDVRDIDLLMSSSNDARDLLERLDIPAEPDRNHAQFRSEVFGTWHAPPRAVEIFAGFSIKTSRGWEPVTLTTREEVTVGRSAIFVPSASELHQLLLAFGRAKDLERAKLLPGVSEAVTDPARLLPPDRRRSSS